MLLPAIPNEHALAVMILTVVALILFTRENIPLESSSLMVLVALTIGFEIFPFHGGEEELHAEDFFYGFGHEALVAVIALMIAGRGLVRTGALEPIGRALASTWKRSPALSLLLTLLIGATLSAFVNNTPIVVLMLPILVGVSFKTGTSSSGTLLPMGLATIVGGMATTIGTSTNLLVVSVAADMGVTPFSMFDFALPVLVAGGVAITYLWLIAPRFLPDRKPPLSDISPRVFTAQIQVDRGGYADGRKLAKVAEKAGGLKVTRVTRGPGQFMSPLPDLVIQAGDMLMVSDTPENLREYQVTLGGTLFSGDEPVDEDHPLSAGDQQIAEVVVTGGSAIEGRNLREARLGGRYNLNVMAFHRVGEVPQPRSPELDARTLRAGDVLLVQGAEADIQKVKRSAEILVLDGTADLPRTDKAWIALVVMLGIVTTAAVGVMPIAVSAVAGVLLMLLTGCITWDDAAKALNVQVILIVVVSLALGAALMATGGADYLAQVFLALSAGSPPWVILAGLMLLMAIMTNVVSNNAAAVIGTPIAINIAQRLGMPIEPFVLAVMFGANMSYATPMAYKTNLLVMNAGGYKFIDFVRIGGPMTLMMWVVLSALLVWSYRL